jgi:hypothetical protein
LEFIGFQLQFTAFGLLLEFWLPRSVLFSWVTHYTKFSIIFKLLLNLFCCRNDWADAWSKLSLGGLACA